MHRYYSLLPVAALAILLGSSVLSLPRLAVEQGAPCQTCHINPAGGGMRNEFGNYSVAFQELVLPPVKKLVADRYRSPRLSEGLTVGFDLRYLVFDNGEVLRMQTDAYAAFEPVKDLYYHLRLSDEHGITENFGLLYFAQQKHYIKIGRFAPSHGLRVEDHTAYIRSRTGDDPQLHLDGVALGADLGPALLTVEAFNPDDRGMIVAHAYRPGYIPSLNLGYLAGVSARFSERTGGPGPIPDNRAVFGGLSYDRFTLLGQLDLAGTSPDRLAFYAGLTARLVHGLYVLTEYNFYDPDRDIASGADEFVRFSVEVFPFPFVALRPAYTRYTRGASSGDDDFFVQFHLGY